MVEAGKVGGDAVAEVGPAAAVGARPTQFRHGKEAGEGEVFRVVFRAVLVERSNLLQHRAVDKLVAPEAALHAEHRARGGILARGHRIAFLQRNGRHPRGGLHLARRAAFGKVEIDVRGRRENGLMPEPRGLNGVGHVVPNGCHDGLAHRAALDNLFPADNRFAFLLHHICHHVCEIALQVGGLFQSLAPQNRLALRTFLPTVVDRLVAADVDVFGGKERHGFFKHVGEELVRTFLAHAEQVAADEVLVGHFVLLARAAEPGIGRHGGEHVGGKLYFGDNLHAPHGGVGNHFLNLLLRVETAEALFVLACPRAHFREAGIFLDFEAPARVVDEVELEFVHLIHRHHVDVFLHKVFVVKIACHVEHHASPRVVGSIDHTDAGHAPLCVGLEGRAVDFGRKELQEGLYAVEHAALVVPAYRDALAADLKRVAFGGRDAQAVDFEHDTGAALLARLFPAKAGGAAHGLQQVLCLLRAGGIVGNLHVGRQRERAFLHDYLRGFGDNGNSLRSSACAQSEQKQAQRGLK